jgi:hypothetical protein
MKLTVTTCPLGKYSFNRKYRFAPAAGEFQVRVRAMSGDRVTQPVSDPQTGSGMSDQPTMTLHITAV